MVDIDSHTILLLRCL